jgi:gamma-glutamyl-gamma-aminobutyrate hydrolase PuuD
MRIAISQRIDDFPSREERRDALDQRWAARLETIGLVPVPLPNTLRDPVAWARGLGIGGLVLTGGNDIGGTAPERDRGEGLLLNLAASERWPVLGICRGLQMINVHLGGNLAPVPGQVGVRHRLHRIAGAPRLLSELGAGIEVNSFHAFGIATEGLAGPLLPVLCDPQGFVEAAEHRTLPWAGLMWHPEREPAFSAGEQALLSRLFWSP